MSRDARESCRWSERASHALILPETLRLWEHEHLDQNNDRTVSFILIGVFIIISVGI